MPTCPHCHTTWTWPQATWAFLRMKHWNVACPNCGEKISLEYREQDKIMFARIPYLLLLFTPFLERNWFFVSIVVLALLAPFMLYPFFIKLPSKSKQ